jgi:biopolymer transport protein ExbB
MLSKHLRLGRLLFCLGQVWVLSSPSAQLWANDLSGLQQAHTERLNQSLKQLAREREELRLQVVPLSQDIRKLKTQEQEWRKKIEKLQSVQDSKTVSLSDLKNEVEEQEQEFKHLEDILIREFIAEERSSMPLYSPKAEELRLMDLKIESGELKGSQSLNAQLSSIASLLDDLKDSMGGQKIQAKVLSPKGEWIEGSIVDLGPEQFFFNGEMAGRVTETDAGKAQLSIRQQREVQLWQNKEQSNLPLDVSGGHALKAEALQTGVWEHIQKGGMWVYPIIAFALLAAFTAFLKMLILYGTRVSRPKVGYDIAQLLKAGRKEEALDLGQQQPGSCRGMWLNAIDRGQGNSELSEDIMAEALMEAQPKFERFLSFIAVTAAIAPLLGLLGTVTGIIKTFEMMGVFGAGDPKPLIGGISEALITTELGLILAIPALLFHALLSRRAQSLLAKMERASVAMVNGLAHQNTAAVASTQNGSGTTAANATDAKAASSEGSRS